MTERANFSLPLRHPCVQITRYLGSHTVCSKQPMNDDDAAKWHRRYATSADNSYFMSQGEAILKQLNPFSDTEWL